MDIYQSNISFLSCCTLQYMTVLSYPLCCQPHRMLLTYDRMMHDQSVFVFHFLHMIVVSLFYTDRLYNYHRYNCKTRDKRYYHSNKIYLPSKNLLSCYSTLNPFHVNTLFKYSIGSPSLPISTLRCEGNMNAFGNFFCM